MDLKLRAVSSPSLRWHVIARAWRPRSIHEQRLRDLLAVQRAAADAIFARLCALDETVTVVA